VAPMVNTETTHDAAPPPELSSVRTETLPGGRISFGNAPTLPGTVGSPSLVAVPSTPTMATPMIVVGAGASAGRTFFEDDTAARWAWCSVGAAESTVECCCVTHACCCRSATAALRLYPHFASLFLQ
jgi:hypothetical protein